jgi:DNA-binding LacI/PurR family transcriptional regulator
LVVSTAPDRILRLTEYDYYRRLMDGAASEALARGRWLVLTPTGSEPELLRRLDLDGALVVDPAFGDARLQFLRDEGIKVVVSGRDPDRFDEGYWVDNDFGVGTRLVLDHLRDQGAERIAVLNAPEVSSYALDVREAYLAWCQQHDRPPVHVTVDASIDETAGYAAAQELLSGPDRPDAIFAIIDRVGLGAMLAAESLGIRVPDDLLLAATTNSAASGSVRPPLTVLELNESDVGRLAVQMLLDLVEGREPADRHRIVPISLIVRASSVRA